MRWARSPLDVVETAGRPVRLRLRQRWHRVVAVEEAWVIQGRWWGREERREYVRVRTASATLELYRLGTAWYLSRVVD